ncbi:glycosyltransferase family 2 protein [Geodermatophilus obscurus]|uniref:glycosyltransferase family 2 protein n=1 Tax=Geodermatophilus obscurus TaxID=1861 RepID=UPI0009356216|nr:glycosyltransferase family 2 protein [Geodermatophilus obscurus]
MRFQSVVRGRSRVVVGVLAAASLVAGCAVIGRLLTADMGPVDGLSWWVARIAVFLVVAVEVARLLQVGCLAWFASAAEDPVPMRPEADLRVALLTTIVPDREPVDLVARTLAAMREVRHTGRLDVWILDEGDDPDVRRVAEGLGVHHFSRRGHPEFNRPSGPFRARTKAGNHNAWRALHEASYDVVGQMDPDHVPLPCFLERTLGYFRDPDTAFVVAPQVYGNMYEGFVPHAAAAQSFVFTGVIQRGGNGLGTPLLIGTNHLYRAAAWAAIGGYQDSLIEDHLTGLTISGTVNPSTGRRWRGVYTPDVIAVGEGPTSWTDFFKQQRRWAYGVMDIVLRHSPRLIPRLAPRQGLAYLLLESFYPGCAIAWACGNAATAVYLLGIAPPSLSWWWAAAWFCAVSSALALLGWLRRYDIAPHERAEYGVRGIFASLVSGPVYLSAAVQALLHRPLGYAVTPKGDLASRDTVRTFTSHLTWCAVVGGAVLVGAGSGHLEPLRLGWALLTIVACGALPGALLIARVRSHGLRTSRSRAARPALRRSSGV